MDLNEFCKLSHGRALEAGWWEPGKEKKPLECHMLIVSEVAEASEAVRDKKAPFYLLRKGERGLGGNVDILEAPEASAKQIEKSLEMMPGAKPEGEAVELADAMIRIADWFGRHGWDLEAVVKAKMDYNLTRGYRHGGKAA